MPHLGFVEKQWVTHTGAAPSATQVPHNKINDLHIQVPHLELGIFDPHNRGLELPGIVFDGGYFDRPIVEKAVHRGL